MKRLHAYKAAAAAAAAALALVFTSCTMWCCVHTPMQYEPPLPLAEMLQCVSLSQDWVSVTQLAATSQRSVPIATANEAHG